MTTRTSYEQGTFSWVDLATTDAKAAKKFYGGLFGWTFDDMPAGPGMIYTMCKLGKHEACALYEIGAEMKGTPPHWASYITVKDVDATAKKAAANGGKIIKEPFDVMDVGRQAIVQDPTGATFCLWQAKKHIGAGVVHEPGALSWNELLTNDLDRAGKFYVQTIGWTTQVQDLGPMGTYTLFGRPGDKENKGGMMQISANMKGVPPHWLAYFDVADCDASAKKVTELGGIVLLQPMEIPKVGKFAIVQDPQTASFGLFKMTHA
jgi:predicted enzyme related to lactoylglutathione lyase